MFAQETVDSGTWDMISSNTLSRGSDYSSERWEALIQVEFRSRTLSSSITGFWSEPNKLSVTSPFWVGKGQGSCTISNEEMFSEAQEKHFYCQLNKSPFRTSIYFFLLKYSSKHYFLISSKSIVTDVSQNKPPPSEVLCQWLGSLLFYDWVSCYVLGFFVLFPLRRTDL